MSKEKSVIIEEPVEQVETELTHVKGEKSTLVTTTEKAPYHKPNADIYVTPLLAEKMIKNGWAKAKNK
jgi:hypothetical protein